MAGLEAVVRTATSVSVWTNIKTSPPQENTNDFVEYTAPLTKGPFAIPFYFESGYRLYVTKRNASGNKTILKYLTDYTVANPATLNGSITLTSALTSGLTLKIEFNPAHIMFGGPGTFSFTNQLNNIVNVTNSVPRLRASSPSNGESLSYPSMPNTSIPDPTIDPFTPPTNPNLPNFNPNTGTALWQQVGISKATQTVTSSADSNMFIEFERVLDVTLSNGQSIMTISFQ